MRALCFLLYFVLFLPVIDGVTWSHDYGSFTVKPQRYPYCAEPVAITEVEILSVGSSTTVVAVSKAETSQFIALFDAQVIQECLHPPSVLYPESTAITIRPGAPLALNCTAASLATWSAVVFDATGETPLACAPLLNPSSGKYGFGATAVTTLAPWNETGTVFAVARLTMMPEGDTQKDTVLLYGAAATVQGTLELRNEQCGGAQGITIASWQVAGSMQFDGVQLPLPLVPLASSSSFIFIVQDPSSKRTMEVCSDVTMTDAECLRAVTTTPFIMFVAPYVIFLGMCFIWGCCRGRCQHSKADNTEAVALVNGNLSNLESERASPYEEDVIKQFGFRSNVAGRFLLGCYAALTAWILVQILIVCFDTYALTFARLPYCFFGVTAHPWWIVGTWFWHAIWYSFLVLRYRQVRNFFRVKCPLSEAETVMVWRPKEVEAFITDQGLFVKTIQRFLQHFKVKEDGLVEFAKVKVTPEGKYIDYQFQRHHWNGQVQCFLPREVTLPSHRAGLRHLSAGLTFDEATSRAEIVGTNSIPLAVPSWLVVAGRELGRFFYVYQTMMVWLYFCWFYYQVATPWTLLIISSAALSMWVQHSNAKSLSQLTAVDTSCEVLRSGTWVTVRSDQLVPGDVIRIGSDGWVVPCDAAILSGMCLVDESALTGESMPQQKVAMPADDSEALFDPMAGDRKHCLFAGTVSLRSLDEGCLPTAIVLTTGIRTSKGKLLATILWPKQLKFTFDEHMKIIMLLLGCFALFLLIFNTIHKWRQGHHSIPTLFLYANAICTQVLSPLIPALLVVGQTAAASRLRKRGIFCTNPRRVTIAGKVKCMCFDKTGTLTNPGLDFAGPCPLIDGKLAPGPIHSDDLGTAPKLMLHAMASCHSLTMWDGHLVGNEVEVKMFSATGWQLVEGSGQLPELRSPSGLALQMLRRFDFDHDRMTMSVVIQDVDHITAFTKGSFERIQERCCPGSMPSDFSDVCQLYAAQGFYTLAIAFKHLDKDIKCASLTRDAVEKDLQLLGLLLFRNVPKPDAAATILALQKGAIRPVMVTGDATLTGIAIARSISLLPPSKDVVLLDAKDGGLLWSVVGQSGLPEAVTKLEARNLLKAGTEAAITGAAFATLQGSILSTDFYEEPGGLLLVTRIFGRMSPEQKVQCVELHMSLGVIVGMCGDGGNDAGALRAAHVGIAFSDSDASMVSPFTSTTKTVMSVVDVVREGRCALCTSFAVVKYQIMYGLIISIIKLVTFSLQTLLGAWMWVYMDCFISLIVSVTLTLAKPERELAPSHPTSSLLSPQHVCATSAQLAVHSITTYLTVLWCRTRSFFIPFDATGLNALEWWKFTHNYEATVLFTLVCTQALGTGVAFSLGGVYRLSPFTNPIMVTLWLLVAGGICLMILPDDWWLSDFCEIASSTEVIAPCNPSQECYDDCLHRPHEVMPQWFRVALMGVCGANMLLVILIEKIALVASVSSFLKSRFGKKKLQVRP